MKWKVPNQHGAWSMLILPFLIGGFAGGWTWLHIPLAVAWLFVYMGIFFAIAYIKPRRKRPEILRLALVYVGIAVTAAVPVLVIEWRVAWFALCMIPFGAVNVYFAKRNDERNVWNDVSAVASFCVGGLASFYVGAGQVDARMVWLFVLPYLYFLGSIFYVKTLIREKGSVWYRNLSWGYHGLLVTVLFVFGLPLLAFTYVPSLLRAVLLYGKKVPVMKVGILEIVNSLIVLLGLSWFAQAL